MNKENPSTPQPVVRAPMPRQLDRRRKPIPTYEVRKPDPNSLEGVLLSWGAKSKLK